MKNILHIFWVRALSVFALTFAWTAIAAVVDNAGGITVSHTTGDMDLNNHLVHTAGNGVATTDLATVGQIPTIAVSAVTTKALSTYTYGNGSSGVGATITGNANQACDTIDGLTPSTTAATGSYTHVLVNNGAAFSDNGVYQVTQVGDGTHPCILTRDSRADSPSEIRVATIHVTQGNIRKGAIYEYTNDPNITVGTTALAWIRTDGRRGLSEYSEYVNDLDKQTNAIANSTVETGAFFFTISGGGVSVSTSTPTERGVFIFGTGNTATGLATASLSAANGSIDIDTTQYDELDVRIAGPSQLSNGTDTFRIIAGLASGITTAATDGIWLENTQATDTHWIGTTRASSTSTNTLSDTVQVATYFTMKAKHYAGESTIHFYNGATGAEFSSSPSSTNVPFNTPLTPLITITKSAGTSCTGASCTFKVDFFRVVQAWPNGRA